MAIDEKKLIKDLLRWYSGKKQYCINYGYNDLLNDFEDCFDAFEDIIKAQPKLDVPDNNVEKMNREFEELEVTYYPDDLCTYPEYMGKPYFAIKYKENGNHFVGYGTYSPEVLSRYLRDYFMQSAMPKESKWIPASESPKETGAYYVTIDDSFAKELKVYIAVYDGSKWQTWANVIAWMPLPEAYKGE